MTRTFTKYASATVKQHLHGLLGSPGAIAYRAHMQALGHSLGRVVGEMLGHRKKVLLACTVEDADFLARGLLSELMEAMGPQRVALACFWNDRISAGRRHPVEVAPIRRRYIEPHQRNIHAVVIVKSIISTACVVRTNLLDLLDETTPQRIIVAAPVLYKDAAKSLEQEFPENIAEMFEYVFFAKDSVRSSDGIVHPGIGGQVYKLLDLGTARDKNQYNPTVVRTRRRQLVSGK